MKCLKKELLIQYLDNELPARVVLNVEDHLRICPDCRMRLSQIREEVALVKDALDELNPREIPLEDFDYEKASRPSAVPARVRKPARFGTRARSLRLAAAAAAVLLMLIGGLHIAKDRAPALNGNDVALYEQVLIEGSPNEFWHNRQLVVRIINEDERSEERIITSKNEESVASARYRIP
jgi:hypothetical protein